VPRRRRAGARPLASATRHIVPPPRHTLPVRLAGPTMTR